jgi:hypothetical protein
MANRLTVEQAAMDYMYDDMGMYEARIVGVLESDDEALVLIHERRKDDFVMRLRRTSFTNDEWVVVDDWMDEEVFRLNREAKRSGVIYRDFAKG